ncbi:cellulose binding domain-containing protein [Lentzea flaviverrucosa]|uniref:Poly(3-hydroxybutyrate) depolymerase n=1 Tax=Lentzea flaviverrucosa TaxID=200379 RepID=A0A1H9IY92_9PSEU|nr:cellulose binding domain-containing protein [Lentzea flaviverrucosa]RDI16802.1 poly(3-hydroxybutyrate) depolymerase [Lentzea flaviverrucosa]SEQ79564.1 Poly(3-hydroxybutyrate) depolymerase [Lentzea flaviverrucosa]
MSRHRSVLAAAAASVVVFLGAAGIALGGQTAGETGTAAATAGCGKPPALTSGQHTINSGGQNRTFILRLPPNYDNNRQYRLFVGFHWRGGTANDVDSGGTDGYNWSYYGLRRLSDAANNGTIFVAPQGNGNGWANPGGQDLRFVDDLVNRLDSGLCIDTTQRFAGGFSYGGGMSYAVACARANVFRAVVAYSGAQLSGCDGGTQPIGYMGIHGISDNVLGIGLGRGLRDTFVRNNGCTPQNAPEPRAGSRTHIVTNYSGCRAGYPVVWAAFDGGHTPGPIDSGGDGWRTWTSGEAWKFLTQFAGGGPTSTTTTTTTTTTSPPGDAACRVGNVISAWNNGLTSNITITNTGSSTISGWSLVFTLPGGQTITSGWSATYSPASGQVTARNVQYNGDIAPNASITVGFQATHTGDNSAPASYSLNGNTCSVA